MGDLVILIARVLRFAVDILQLLIILHVVFSWVGYNPPLNQITRYYYAVLEAVYRPVQRTIPVVMGGLDFTPFVVLILLTLIDRYLLIPLLRAGFRM